MDREKEISGASEQLTEEIKAPINLDEQTSKEANPHETGEETPEVPPTDENVEAPQAATPEEEGTPETEAQLPAQTPDQEPPAVEAEAPAATPESVALPDASKVPEM